MVTSDGISDADWNIVRQCTEGIVQASSLGADDSLLISNLFSELRKLEAVYGRLPSILATEADFTEDICREQSLLKEAYASAYELSDYKNMTYVSASLAEFYIERMQNLKKAVFWQEALSGNLCNYSDEYVEEVLKDLNISNRGQSKPTPE